MTKVVVDTNVFVSSFFGGKPRQIIDLWKTGELTLCLSEKIVEEYVEVLRRLGLQDEKELKELLAVFARGFNILFAAAPPELKVIKDDPDDDKFVECAVALKCDFIISGDKHLLSVKDYMGICILNPDDFLKIKRQNP